MVPWVSDARLVFLVWFVSIAVVVAVVLIFVEIKLKKKRELAAEKRRQKTPIERMKVVLSKGGNAKKKLEVVGKTAKGYFEKEYAMSSGLDYSELAKRFDKKGKVLEAEFCKRMFELYYSNKEITEKVTGELGDMLVEISRKKNLSKDMTKVPSVWDKIDRTIEEKKGVVVNKAREHVGFLREKMDRRARVEAREKSELLSWVKKAIRTGYDRKKVFVLLKEGGKSGGDIKKILKIYDGEMLKISQKKNSAPFYTGGEGIAQRLILKEKNRLEEMEVLSA